jgi:hypothetical protein
MCVTQVGDQVTRLLEAEHGTTVRLRTAYSCSMALGIDTWA